MCSRVSGDESLAPDAVSIIRGTQRKPGAQRRSSHLPAIGPLGAGPASSALFSWKELATPVPTGWEGGEEGMLSLWAPGEETRDLLLSRPTPSPQYRDPNPKSFLSPPGAASQASCSEVTLPPGVWDLFLTRATGLEEAVGASQTARSV